VSGTSLVLAATENAVRVATSLSMAPSVCANSKTGNLLRSATVRTLLLLLRVALALRRVRVALAVWLSVLLWP